MYSYAARNNGLHDRRATCRQQHWLVIRRRRRTKNDHRRAWTTTTTAPIILTWSFCERPATHAISHFDALQVARGSRLDSDEDVSRTDVEYFAATTDFTDTCKVCLLALRSGMALVPCGHAHFCAACADAVTKTSHEHRLPMGLLLCVDFSRSWRNYEARLVNVTPHNRYYRKCHHTANCIFRSFMPEEMNLLVHAFINIFLSLTIDGHVL